MPKLSPRAESTRTDLLVLMRQVKRWKMKKRCQFHRSCNRSGDPLRLPA